MSNLNFFSFLCAAVSGDLGFQFGTITWTSNGNEVSFTVLCAFQQTIQNVSVGDIVPLTGQESPQFLYGDSGLARILKMRVTAFSIQRQWLMGEVQLTHHYSSPISPDGSPWKAQFIGCCRLSGLQNNAAKPWVLTAEIDLNRANMSPLPRILPLITVPYDGSAPMVNVASDDFEHVEWSLGVPFDVGGSVKISSSNGIGYLKVDIGKLWADANSPTLDCEQASSSPGCLIKLLQAAPSMTALTIEGWVKSTVTDQRAIFSTSMAGPSGNISTM